MTSAIRKSRRYLLELTGLPTAPGNEHYVINWILQWASQHKNIQVRRDRYGNVLLKNKTAARTNPLIFTAHMDHPAFVVRRLTGPNTLQAQFRGSVADTCFKIGTALNLYHKDLPAQSGRLAEFFPAHSKFDFKHALIQFNKPVQTQPGDILTWRLPPPDIRDGYLFAPVCDDLAGVAAAISAFEQLSTGHGRKPDVRVLLTRAEEVGFLGAIGACRSRLFPKQAILIALESSRSFLESPIGAGPIVRVGDMLSTFDADTTYRVGQIAKALADSNKRFQWQRKLMAGGACEATAFKTFGYRATCVCLPLGNYHNMKTRKNSDEFLDGRITSEMISVNDYHHLVQLLVELGSALNNALKSPSLRSRLNELFSRRKSILT